MVSEAMIRCLFGEVIENDEFFFFFFLLSTFRFRAFVTVDFDYNNVCDDFCFNPSF